MLRILHPADHIQERRYIHQVMLGDWLGLEYVSEIHPYETTRIESSSSPGGPGITICDVFFRCRDDAWLTEQSLPGERIEHWIPPPGTKTIGDPLPVIFGKKLGNGDYLAIENDQIEFGIDIFGSSFFMLSRYEELVITKRDSFGRFPASESTAYARDFLRRPIVNEYLEVLWWAIKRSFPGLSRRDRAYKLVLSHDVDIPFAYADSSWAKLARMMGGSIVQSGLRINGAKEAARIAKVRLGAYEMDPLNEFEFLMDCAERFAVVSTFNFVCGRTNPRFDPSYTIHDQAIRKLVARIRDRGNLIGLHGSFDSYNSFDDIKKEFAAFQALMKKEDIQQDVWGGRQHYLRWEAPTTWRIWNGVGMSYDSTLGYGDRVGFRCGTCYEYAAFDLHKRSRLNLLEQPLLIMEVSLLSPEYMGLSFEEAFEEIERIVRACRLFHGNCTLLWHNHSLQNPMHRELFVQSLRAATSSY